MPTCYTPTVGFSPNRSPNRPIKTGTFNNTLYITLSTMQANLTSQNLASLWGSGPHKPYVYTTTLSFSPALGNPDPQTIHYDNYDWRASCGNPLRDTYYIRLRLTVPALPPQWFYPQPNVQSSQTRGLVTARGLKQWVPAIPIPAIPLTSMEWRVQVRPVPPPLPRGRTAYCSPGDNWRNNHRGHH